MRFFPCLFSSPRAEAVDKLYDQHRVSRASRTIGKHPALGAPYGRGGAYGDNPYADAKQYRPSSRDDGFDTTGFMLGYATGVPISPSHGISAGAMIGAAMHQNNQAAAASPTYSAPDPAPPTSCDSSSSSSSDSGSSSSSCDSGSSGGGGGE